MYIYIYIPVEMIRTLCMTPVSTGDRLIFERGGVKRSAGTIRIHEETHVGLKLHGWCPGPAWGSSGCPGSFG